MRANTQDAHAQVYTDPKMAHFHVLFIHTGLCDVMAAHTEAPQVLGSCRHVAK